MRVITGSAIIAILLALPGRARAQACTGSMSFGDAAMHIGAGAATTERYRQPNVYDLSILGGRHGVFGGVTGL